MKLSTIMVDPLLCREGVWKPLTTQSIENGGIGLLVASMASPTYEEALRAAATNSGADLENDPEERVRQVINEAVAASVLLDWKNIEDEETGEKVEFSIEKALEYLGDPRLNTFRQRVLLIANSLSNYRPSTVEDDEGN